MFGLFDRLSRPLMRALDPEDAHALAIKALCYMPLSRPAPDAPELAVRAFGLNFPNPIGLAAGFDKNAQVPDALLRLGFGFVEVGTVTPRAQAGNPRPRLFRLETDGAVINRLGFNNEGVDRLVHNVRNARYQGVLGVNVGKNADTPIGRATDDYVACLRKVYPLASYVTVNISSPNTKDLRTLQGAGELAHLLGTLKAEQRRLADEQGRHVPLAVKIAPDLDAAQVHAIADALRRHSIEAVIATNTTTARDAVAGQAHADEAGGLSGAPLADRATAVIEQLAGALGGEVPIIGVGGILGADDARRKIKAGAQLVQLYTGLVYRGPQLVTECVTALCEDAIKAADKRR